MEFVDSEDEREYKDMLKSWTRATFAWEQAADKTAASGATLVLMSGAASQTLAKILFQKTWTKAGEGTGESRKEPDEDVKSDLICTLHMAKPGIYMLMPEDKMKSNYASQLADGLFKEVKWGKIVILDDVYKTTYPQLGSYPEDGSVPIITHASSFLAPEDQWIRKLYESAHFMAPTGGLAAALIVLAEMSGLSAFKLTALTNSHYLSAEMMEGAYRQAFKQLGLGDLQGLQGYADFRECLKEANQRSNSIFS